MKKALKERGEPNLSPDEAEGMYFNTVFLLVAAMLTVVHEVLTWYPNENNPPWEYTETSGIVMETSEIITNLTKLITYLNARFVERKTDGRLEDVNSTA